MEAQQRIVDLETQLATVLEKHNALVVTSCILLHSFPPFIQTCEQKSALLQLESQLESSESQRHQLEYVLTKTRQEREKASDSLLRRNKDLEEAKNALHAAKGDFLYSCMHAWATIF